MKTDPDNRFVGLMLDHNLNLLVGLLAILKSGNAFVPIDPKYPIERINLIVRDCELDILVTESKWLGTARRIAESSDFLKHIICVDRVDSHGNGEDAPEILDFHSYMEGQLSEGARGLGPEDFVYVIFTSGSTGVPKGVPITNENLVPILLWGGNYFDLGEHTRVLQNLSFCFDFGVFEILTTMLFGGTLYFTDRRDASGVSYYKDFIEQHRINTVHSTPSYFREVLAIGGKLGTLKIVHLGGEPLTKSVVERVYETVSEDCRVFNGYGPTEASVNSTIYALENECCLNGIQSGSVFIGQPTANNEIYVLDAHLQPVPVGIPGELFIGGSGLARAYLRRPDLSALRFIPHPFSPLPGRRLYRTGDLVRFSSDGQLEFLTRLDHQVKLRGFRIELAEIEAALFSLPDLAEAAVVAVDSPSDKRLVAFVVPSPLASFSANALRVALRDRLPDFMIPSLFLPLGALPLTAHGKLDRQQLLQLASSAQPASRAACPLSPPEELIAAIWEQVLAAPVLSPDDHFFDLGGHSLLAAQVVSRLREAFGVEVSLRELFEHPRLEELAEEIEKRLRGGAEISRPLAPVERRQRHELSYAQQRMWFLWQLEPESTAYNIMAAVRVRGELKAPALEESFRTVIKRHESLRTRFESEAGKPMQVVEQEESFRLEAERGGAQELERILREESESGFDLERGPLLRVRLVEVNGQEHVLVVRMHHIISDGWSVGVLIKELSRSYERLVNGEGEEERELPVQYLDYAEWQREWLRGEVLGEQIGYWREQLAGVTEALELPADRPRPAMLSGRGGIVEVALSREISERLRELSRNQGVTLYMLLLAGCSVLLSRYSGQREVTVGTPVAGRTRREVEGLIGFFVNTLVMRVGVRGEERVKELLERVREICLGAYAHQDVPFEKLVEELQPERDLSRQPLFQVMFTYNNLIEEKVELGGLEVEWMRVGGAEAKFDLSVSLREREGEIRGEIGYSVDLYEEKTIRRIGRHLERLLGEMAEGEGRLVRELRMLSDEERHQLLVDWNQTQRDYPRSCLHHLIAEQAQRCPQAVALMSRGRELTYRELDERANQLAHYLRGQGVEVESRVGVCLERSIELVIALLGVLKAGAAYVPLDPAYPAQRLQWMMEDAGLSAALTDLALSGSHGRLIDLRREQAAIAHCPVTEVESGVAPENLAYIIYTSGSTGRPKGVAIAHQSATVLLNWAQEYYSRQELSCVLAGTSVCFDLSVFEIFVPLAVGGKVVIVGDVLELGEPGVREEVVLINTVPSAMAELLRLGAVPESVRVVNLAGEPLQKRLVEGIYGLGHVERVINLYGPTEDTTYTTVSEVERGSRPDIGRPIGQTRTYILDEEQEVVTVGVTGEIYLGGSGLARGYWGRAEQTAEKFVPDPYSEQSGARMYRTGDLVRYRRDGAIEYIGRKDNQVKVRGYRIELGEIEQELLGCEEIKESVVVVQEDGGGNRRLVAYVASEEEVNERELKERLRRRLPEYLVPQVYVRMERLPLTANGKIDRRALPEPEPESVSGQAPRTPLEEVIAAIWEQVLAAPVLSPDDHFFDLGGHSLLATQVISRIRDSFGVNLSVRLLFEKPTLAGFAVALQRALYADRQPLPPLLAAGNHHHLEASSAQARLWFLDQLEAGLSAYHIPVAVRLRGPLHLDSLQLSLQTVIDRHDSLRTRFDHSDGRLLQIIEPQLPFSLLLEDFSASPADLSARAQQLARLPFDLRRAPLLRAHLLCLADQDHLLVLVLHHIIADGWSMAILVKEVAAAYAAFRRGLQPQLPSLPVQYADYALWQQHYLQSGVYQQQLAYWQEQLAGAPALLDLPTDRPRPPVLSSRGDRCRLRLSAELSQGLRRSSRENGVSLFMLLLAGLGALLRRYTGQSEMVIGSPVANRSHQQVEGLIGFFVNTLALRLEVASEMSLRRLVEQAREVVLAAQQNQELPFEKLVEHLQPQRSLAWSPLFQVMLTYQKAILEEIEIEELSLTPEEISYKASSFDLTFMVTDTRQGLTISAEYSTDLFEAATVERLLAHYEKVLEAFVEAPDRKVFEILLLTAEEAHRAIFDWNNNKAAFPRNQLAHEIFEEQARRAPDALAIQVSTQRITYGELNAKANRLANYLTKLGVVPEGCVGIGLERSIDYVISFLAVLKAGAAIVPLDPHYPAERLHYMIEDASVSAILTCLDLLNDAPAFGRAGRVICLDRDESLIKLESDLAPVNHAQGGNLAYVIYTSGSTGRPKGVAVPHETLVNHGFAIQRQLGFDTEDRVLQFASLSFDVSIEEILPTLMAGAKLILRTAEGWTTAEFCQRLVEFGLTVVNLPTSFWHRLVSEEAFARAVPGGAAPRLWIVGGESISPESVRAWNDSPFASGRLINGYGVTEATITSTLFEISSEWRAGNLAGKVPIGRPIGNIITYILDEKRAIAPIGVKGELCIGGLGVARGYLNRPELTAGQFVPDALGGVPGARLYQTGDWARYLPNGNIEFLGRLDDQVKLRGFRVEPGEIASIIQEHEAVKECVVLVEEKTTGDHHIVAYIVAKSGSPSLAHVLRTHCRERLPDFMRPAVFVRLEALPLAPTGKIDRTALPRSADEKRRGTENYHAPRNPVEELLAEIWAGSLGIERIGIYDDFFDLGGHSLLATHMISKVREVLQVEIPVRKVFQLKTIADLAAWIIAEQREASPILAAPIRKVSREEDLPSSFAQQRLWFFHQLSPESPAYNVPTAVRLAGDLDLQALELTFSKLVERHETLRTTFRVKNNRPVQVVSQPHAVSVPVEDLSDLAAEEQSRCTEQFAAREASLPFDLAEGPLFRIRLLRLNKREHIALMTMHHIISDGWSMALLTQEVGQLYQACLNGETPDLIELPIQYADYACWQHQWLQGDNVESYLDYWKGRLNGALPIRELPTDRLRPPVPNYRGEYRRFVFPTDLERALRVLSREEGVTLFMTLLAVFDLLLSRYSGTEDIIVGSAIAGRNRAEVENLIGFFVNMLVLRTDLSGDPRFRELLARVKETAFGAYTYQDLPFDLLVDELQADRDPGRSPLFQVAFGLQNHRQMSLDLPGLKLSPYPVRYEAVRYDLTVWVSEEPDGLVATWAFRSDLFNASTIERMHTHYQLLLRNVIDNPNARISDLEMLTEAEKEQMHLARRKEQAAREESLARVKRKPIAVRPEDDPRPSHGSTSPQTTVADEPTRE